MSKPVFKRLKGQDIQIQAAIWDGDKQNTVLCIPGLAANCRSWDTICSKLSPEHYLVAVDLRGRGMSDRPETGYSIQQHVEDMRNLLDDLGIEKTHLMGHSFGTYVCMAFAADYPERTNKLILIDGGGSLSEEQVQNIMPIVQLPLMRLGKVYATEEDYLKEIKDRGVFEPWTTAIETLYLYDLESVEGGVTTRTKLSFIQEELGNMQQYPLQALFPQVIQPVLILRSVDGVFGDKDVVLPRDVAIQMTRSLPDARSIDIPNSDHFSIVLAPVQYRDRLINDFLTTEQ